jgi:hypothetical protein
MTFHDGEHALSAWMAENAFVCWYPTQEPWIVEERLISDLSLPLNLDMNGHPFRATLSALRSAAKQAARAMPAIAHEPGQLRTRGQWNRPAKT